jgi:hypothetical protein
MLISEARRAPLVIGPVIPITRVARPFGAAQLHGDQRTCPPSLQTLYLTTLVGLLHIHEAVHGQGTRFAISRHSPHHSVQGPFDFASRTCLDHCSGAESLGFRSGPDGWSRRLVPLVPPWWVELPGLAMGLAIAVFTVWFGIHQFSTKNHADLI